MVKSFLNVGNDPAKVRSNIIRRFNFPEQASPNLASIFVGATPSKARWQETIKLAEGMLCMIRRPTPVQETEHSYRPKIQGTTWRSSFCKQRHFTWHNLIRPDTKRLSLTEHVAKIGQDWHRHGFKITNAHSIRSPRRGGFFSLNYRC